MRKYVRQPRTPATRRKYKDIQQYYGKMAAITQNIGGKPVRKYSDEFIYAKITHKFYLNETPGTERFIDEVLKMQLD